MQIEPLPEVSASEVIGLLEYLDDEQGKEDIYKLAEAIQYESGELLSIIKMAEMLRFAETPGGDVVILDLGKKLIKSKIGQRKLLIRGQLKDLKLIQHLVKALQSSDEGRLDRESTLEALSSLLPHENIEGLFKTIVSWGRYAELLGYNDDTQMLYLDEESFPSRA